MILNRQRGVPVSIRKLDTFAAAARRLLHLSKESFTICLVSNMQIARWNRAYRGKKKSTDVLSFPAIENAISFNHAPKVSRNGRSVRGTGQGGNFIHVPGHGAYLGDIAIAPAVARRNALRFGRTFDQEMRILVLHGMLHLMGYDHETDNGQMERRERKLRRDLKLE